MESQTSHFVREMPWTELDAHIRRNGLAILVSGSVECHGPHLPMGTDTLIAEAVALGVARQCDGVIFPPFEYTYSGGTTVFPGTVSIAGQAQQTIARAVLLKLIHDGYRKILHIQWHAPYYVSQQLTREIFEETGVPVLFVGMLNMPLMRSPQMTELIGTEGYTWEAVLAAAALPLLGRTERLHLEKFPADVQPEPRPADPWLNAMAAVGGVVGQYFTHPSQHVPVRRNVDVAAGTRALALMATTIAEVVGPLGQYAAACKARPPSAGPYGA